MSMVIWIERKHYLELANVPHIMSGMHLKTIDRKLLFQRVIWKRAWHFYNAVCLVICEGYNLLTCGKTLVWHIISLIVQVWTHKTCLTPPLFFFIEVPLPSLDSERSWMCARVLNLQLFLRFWICSDSVILFCFPSYDMDWKPGKF